MNGSQMPDLSHTGWEGLVDEWLALPEAAGRLGIAVNKVKQLLRDGELVAVPIGANGAPHIPGRFIVAGQVVRGLGGTLTVLADAGYSAEESIRWLCSAEARVDGAPVDALAAGRIKTVRRVAQTVGF